MLSDIRKLVYEAMDQYAAILKPHNARILDIGIAGDPQLPGASSPSEKYKWFGPGNRFKTLDSDPKWRPDVVGDICAAPFKRNSFDLVIATQLLEHVYDFRQAISEIYRITDRFAIIDCPFICAYHPELPSFEDYWRISPSAMRLLLEEVGFKIIDLQLRGGILTTALVEKSHARRISR